VLHLRASFCLLLGTAALAACGADGRLYAPAPLGPSAGGFSGGSSPHRPNAAGYATLYSFLGGSDGSFPIGDLVAVNGALYGTTQFGGATCPDSSFGCGTVFELSAANRESVVYAFRGESAGDGALPLAGLVRVHGELYGTTSTGGAQASCPCGTVFRVSQNGSEAVIHSFTGGSIDGILPAAPLIEAKGHLYGTTVLGGAGQYATGTVFEVNEAGSERVVHSFSGGTLHNKSLDGGFPDAGLTQVGGTLYGTTVSGGGTRCRLGFYQAGCGTIFSVAPSGSESLVHRFRGKGETGDGRGAYPQARLVLVNGELYGTTSGGGKGGCNGTGCGTIFEVAPSGSNYLVLHHFKGADGANPFAGLVEVNGMLYGTTLSGGDQGNGTIFTISPSGKGFQVLHSFQGRTAADGSNPDAALVDVNGVLYGTTSTGGTSSNCGTSGCGTIFKIVP
jgi:uncharacterized repeat protein (TIGR03803 family)